MPLETFPFDAAEFLTESDDQADLLNDALSSGNAAVAAAALDIIARARGMTSHTPSIRPPVFWVGHRTSAGVIAPLARGSSQSLGGLKPARPASSRWTGTMARALPSSPAS